MQVTNVHIRVVHRPKSAVLPLFSTLSTPDDTFWPIEKWPPMRFKEGLKEGSEGGHGPIRYKIREYDAAGFLICEFQRPKGFEGFHILEVLEINEKTTLLSHRIHMKTKGSGTLLWLFGIRQLHDALLEDALDKIENQLMNSSKSTKWSLWVRFLRYALK